MNLRKLLEKSYDTNFLREMIGFAAPRLMEIEVTERRAPGPASAARCGWRSATVRRSELGDELRIAAQRRLLSDLRGASAKALTAVAQEAYIQDILTRSVDELVEAIGMSGISKSQVSRLWEEIGTYQEVCV